MQRGGPTTEDENGSSSHTTAPQATTREGGRDRTRLAWDEVGVEEFVLVALAALQLWVEGRAALGGLAGGQEGYHLLGRRAGKGRVGHAIQGIALAAFGGWWVGGGSSLVC